MKRVQSWLSAFLTLCLLVAGVAGINPRLHAWLDHGAGTTPHRHLSTGGLAVTHLHAGLHDPVADSGPIRISRKVLFGEEKPAASRDHTHQTLSQLLLGGLLEGSVALFAPSIQNLPVVFSVIIETDGFYPSVRNSQSTSRGPPALILL